MNVGELALDERVVDRVLHREGDKGWSVIIPFYYYGGLEAWGEESNIDVIRTEPKSTLRNTLGGRPNEHT